MILTSLTAVICSFDVFVLYLNTMSVAAEHKVSVGHPPPGCFWFKFLSSFWIGFLSSFWNVSLGNSNASSWQQNIKQFPSILKSVVRISCDKRISEVLSFSFMQKGLLVTCPNRVSSFYKQQHWLFSIPVPWGQRLHFCQLLHLESGHHPTTRLRCIQVCFRRGGGHFVALQLLTIQNFLIHIFTLMFIFF